MRETMACATCRRVLEDVTYLGSVVGYQHPAFEAAAGHPPRPVPARELLDPGERCDFCGGWGPTWELPARNFDTLRAGESDIYPGGLRSIGPWLACDECGAFLRRNDWNGLTARAVVEHERMAGQRDTYRNRTIRRVHADLARNVIGPVRRRGE